MKMCFGEQEYFINCRCPGNFIVTDRCPRWDCRSRVETRAIYRAGWCPACRIEAASGQPRGNHPSHRPRSAGSRFGSFRELEAYYGRRLREARQAIERARSRLASSDGSHRFRHALEVALENEREVYRDFDREGREYRAEEARLDALEDYDEWD